MTPDKENQTPNTDEGIKAPEGAKVNTDMSNVLKHIQDLQKEKNDLEKRLSEVTDRNVKLSAKTREGMQSALDTLMKKWMDSCETKDERVKDDFKTGLERLVKNSAEDNGVWQMMVAASALHERQEHDLEKLQTENKDLRARVNGYYGDEVARTVGEKRKAETEAERPEPSGMNIWDEFAAELQTRSMF